MLPSSEDELYRAILLMMVAYLAVAFAWEKWATGTVAGGGKTHYLTRVFDSATFSSSLLLLAGILHKPVLDLIGNVKPFLLVAGLAGCIYGLIALAPKARETASRADAKDNSRQLG